MFGTNAEVVSIPGALCYWMSGLGRVEEAGAAGAAGGGVGGRLDTAKGSSWVFGAHVSMAAQSLNRRGPKMQSQRGGERIGYTRSSCYESVEEKAMGSRPDNDILFRSPQPRITTRVPKISILCAAQAVS